jgi:5-methylthioadenosine/S-adenosylhomocysteine deaminase
MDPQVIAARTALNMATLGGAQAIGLDKEIGALTVGRRADLIQISLSDLHFTPMYDVISHLIYVADEQDVTTVVVDGKVLKRDGKVLTVDEARVRREAEAIAARIRAEVVDKKNPGQ